MNKSFKSVFVLCLILGLSLIFFPVLASADQEPPDSSYFPELELYEEIDYDSAPGEVEYVGEETSEPVKINVVKYNADTVEEVVVSSAADAKEFIEEGFVTWIEVRGVHDEKVIEDFGSAFDIPIAIQSDIMNTTQLPEIESRAGYIFLSLKMLNREYTMDAAEVEQISLVLGDNYLISFQESGGDNFENVDTILELNRGNIRQNGSDYLTFVLVDTVVDSYFPAIDIVNRQIDEVESNIISSPDDEVLEQIYKIKRETTIGRQIITPMREVVSDLASYDYAQITPAVKGYFGITSENVDYIGETVETFSNIASGLVSFYISISGHDTNDILKFLTIFSTVLFVLSFVAAVYGMDLSQLHPKHKMKKLHIILILVMIGITVLSVWLFALAGWL